MGSSLEWVIGAAESWLGVQPGGHGMGVWCLGNSGQEPLQCGFWHMHFPPPKFLSWGAFPDLRAWLGVGKYYRVAQICAGTQKGFVCVLSTKEVQTEASRMSVFGDQRVSRLGETSQQAHYRVMETSADRF